MKKFQKILMFLVLAVFLMAGSAMALPTLPSGYSWTTQAYWYPTDLTTAVSGTSFFQIEVEYANYESDFGLFMQNGTKFQVFDYSQEPIAKQIIYFQSAGSGWEVSKDLSNWFSFDNIFGYYYDVHTGGGSTVNYSYFSDPSFNTEDVGTPHVLMAFDGTSTAYIYLEDLRDDFADWDYEDMTVFASDVAPVPEPATLLLLGSGLIGLAGIGRKKLLRSKK